MKLKEDNQLNEISKKFSEAIKKYTKKEYKEAAADFGKIIAEYKESDFYSVLEIQTKSKSYKNICDQRATKKRTDFDNEDDILNELLFSINIGDDKESEKIIKKLEVKKINSAYSIYLKALFAISLEDIDAGLGLLKKAIAKDEKYKIIANNEPDLKDLQENEEFLSVIE